MGPGPKKGMPSKYFQVSESKYDYVLLSPRRLLPQGPVVSFLFTILGTHCSTNCSVQVFGFKDMYVAVRFGAVRLPTVVSNLQRTG